MRIRYHGFPWVRSKADNDIQQFFIANGRLNHFPKGTRIFSGNDFYPNLSMVLSGIVGKFSEVFRFKDTSKAKAMSILLPNTLLGGTFFLSDRPSNVASVSIRDTILLEIPHKYVWEYTRANHNFGKKLISHIMLDLESDLEGMATIIARPPNERLSVLFKILINHYDVCCEDGWYKIPVNLTHSELSQIIFTIPLTLNRLLLEWKKKGLYKKDGRSRYVHESLLVNLYDWKESAFPPAEFADPHVHSEV